MPLGAFHHVGVLTDKPDEVVSLYEWMGYRVDWRGDDPVQDAHIVLLLKEGHPMIEIIHPLSKESPVYDLLKKQGAGPYHTCYEVDDIESVSKELRKQKIIPTTKALEAVAFGGRQVRFFYSASAGLIEVVETATS